MLCQNVRGFDVGMGLQRIFRFYREVKAKMVYWDFPRLFSLEILLIFREYLSAVVWSTRK